MPPVVDDPACIGEIAKPLLVQAAVSKSTIEGLNERMSSLAFSGLNEM
jgi:hypothetical protein